MPSRMVSSPRSMSTTVRSPSWSVRICARVSSVRGSSAHCSPCAPRRSSHRTDPRRVGGHFCLVDRDGSVHARGYRPGDGHSGRRLVQRKFPPQRCDRGRRGRIDRPARRCHVGRLPHRMVRVGDARLAAGARAQGGAHRGYRREGRSARRNAGDGQRWHLCLGGHRHPAPG